MADEFFSLLVWVALAAARSVPLAFTVPVFGGPNLSAQIRFSIGLGLAVLSIPYLGAPVVVSPAALVVLVGREVAVGFTLGFVASLWFRAAEMAGKTIDTLRGANMSEVLAPLSGERQSPMAMLFGMLAVVVFLEMGGMVHIAAALAHSYEALPVGRPVSWAFKPTFVTLVAGTAGRMIEASLGLAAPVLVAMLVADVLLGFLARSVPQIPVFFVGMPAKALGALALVLLGLGTLRGALEVGVAELPRLVWAGLKVWG